MNMTIFKRTPLWVLLSCFMLVFGGINSAIAETTTTVTTTTATPPAPTADKPPIKLGASLTLTGNNAPLGQNLQLGAQVYFDKINADGGIDGRKIELITIDNGYDPERAASDVRKLIDEDKVLALLLNNGSPMAVVTVPIFNEKKALFFGAFPGTDILHKNPPDRYVINLRAGYADEVSVLVKGLLSSGIKPDEIAFFTQNDAFGDSIYLNAMKALKASGYSNPESLPYGRYTRDTVNVEEGLSRILQEVKKPPKAIILGGNFAPNAKFIKLASKEFPNAIFVGISGLISPKDLDNTFNDKVVLSQSVPHFNADLPSAHEYLEDMKKYGGDAKPNFTSFNGYLVAKLFVIALKKAAAENKLDREGIIDVIESLNNVDIGTGARISFSKTNHDAFRTVWATIYLNGEFVALEWPQLRAKLKK